MSRGRGAGWVSVASRVRRCSISRNNLVAYFFSRTFFLFHQQLTDLFHFVVPFILVRVLVFSSRFPHFLLCFSVFLQMVYSSIFLLAVLVCVSCVQTVDFSCLLILPTLSPSPAFSKPQHFSLRLPSLTPNIFLSCFLLTVRYSFLQRSPASTLFPSLAVFYPTLFPFLACSHTPLNVKEVLAKRPAKYPPRPG